MVCEKQALTRIRTHIHTQALAFRSDICCWPAGHLPGNVEIVARIRVDLSYSFAARSVSTDSLFDFLCALVSSLWPGMQLRFVLAIACRLESVFYLIKHQSPDPFDHHPDGGHSLCRRSPFQNARSFLTKYCLWCI